MPAPRRPLLWRCCALVALILSAAAAGGNRRGTRRAGVNGAARAQPAPVILARGNGPEPESLDVCTTHVPEPALTILRDLLRGLDRHRRREERRYWPRRINAKYPPTAKPIDSPCAATAAGRTGRRWWPTIFSAAWRRSGRSAHRGPIRRHLLGAGSGRRGDHGRPRGVPAPWVSMPRIPPTLVVNLARPTPYFLSVLTHPATFPIHRGSLAAYGRRLCQTGHNGVERRLRLTRWDFGSHLVAVRNTRYWNDPATRLDEVEYYSFADADTELRAFRTGQVDITSTIPAAQVSVDQSPISAQHCTWRRSSRSITWASISERRRSTGRRSCARRLSLVIDRERIVQSVTGTGESPGVQLRAHRQVRLLLRRCPEYASMADATAHSRARQLLLNAGMAPPSDRGALQQR